MQLDIFDRIAVCSKLHRMNKSHYHSALRTMQEAGVSKDYQHGWATGALANPALEEQRVTDAYSAGYEDGTNDKTDAYSSWIVKSS